jgi:hypothetical protein
MRVCIEPHYSTNSWPYNWPKWSNSSLSQEDYGSIMRNAAWPSYSGSTHHMQVHWKDRDDMYDQIWNWFKQQGADVRALAAREYQGAGIGWFDDWVWKDTNGTKWINKELDDLIPRYNRMVELLHAAGDESLEPIINFRDDDNRQGLMTPSCMSDQDVDNVLEGERKKTIGENIAALLGSAVGGFFLVRGI